MRMLFLSLMLAAQSALGQTVSLVGSWSHIGTSSLDARQHGQLQASSVSESQRRARLTPDGRFVITITSRTIAGGSGVWVDSGEQTTTYTGRWQVQGETLRLSYDSDDGEEEVESYTFSVSGPPGARRLLLRSATEQQEWAEG